MTELKDLEITYDKPNWCPGCGNFGLWGALKNAIIELNLNPWEVVLVSGIGCSSKMPYWIKTYGFSSLHGRPTPVAEGIKLANNSLAVIVIAGDGDQYGEGLSHLIHAARRNIDITVIVHNNQIYGLTTGQYSPTTDLNEKNKTSPTSITEIPLNPLFVTLSAGATFVARGFAGDIKHQAELIKEGIKHKGFSVIDAMQPCVTFNHKNTFPWFRERIYKLEEEKHDFNDKSKAITRIEEWPLTKVIKEGEKERIPTGIFYKKEEPAFEEGFPQIDKISLDKQPITDISIDSILEKLM